MFAAAVHLPDHSMAVGVVPIPARLRSAPILAASCSLAALTAAQDLYQLPGTARVHVERPKRVHHCGAGDVPRDVTTHAIGHRAQPVARISGILVALAD